VKSCVEYVRLLESIQLRLGVSQLIVNTVSTHITTVCHPQLALCPLLSVSV